jgi:hypothetical protein
MVVEIHFYNIAVLHFTERKGNTMAAGMTYFPIATTTLVSDSASVTFSNISGSYTDLIIVTNTGVASGGGGSIYVQVGNGSVDTGSNYSYTYIQGDGSTTESGRASNLTAARTMRTTGTTVIANGFLHLMNYSNTTTFKTMLSRGNVAGALVIALVNLWRSTSAINIITMTDESSRNFLTGSTFTLYGIAAA